MGVAMRTLGAYCLLMVTLGFWPQNQAQKPVKEVSVLTSYKVPPDSLAGLAAVSDSVVVLEVATERGLEIGSNVYTEVTGRITEAVKTDPLHGPFGDTVEFLIDGGVVDKGDHFVRHTSRQQPRLVVGKQYVVALAWYEHGNAFVSAFGPGSIFRVNGGKIDPQAKTELADKVRGLELPVFVSMLKGGASR